MARDEARGTMDEQALHKPHRKRTSAPLAAPFPIPIQSLDEDGVALGPFEGQLVENAVWITEKRDMDSLYRRGFFGKGMLSRSGPGRDDQLRLPKRRTSRRPENEAKELEEDVTTRNRVRRKRRREWFAEAGLEPTAQNETEITADTLPTDAVESSDDSPLYPVKEYLQLSLCEAVFLSYALGCLIVRDSEGRALSSARLWASCRANQTDFIASYVAYHHLRSKGWVVRSGEKYGVEYLIYKHGPPYYHSNAAILIRMTDAATEEAVDSTSAFTWQYLAGVHRINAAVSKDLILLHVLKPADVNEEAMSRPDCLHRFGVQEIALRRWIPDRVREFTEDEEE